MHGTVARNSGDPALAVQGAPPPGGCARAQNHNRAGPESRAEDADQRWYACYTRSRHEKQVDALLGRRGIESYLPLIPRLRQWKDRKKVVAWPLFPGYVFSRFSMRQLHQVLEVPGVATVVRSNGQPVAIATAELDNVRRFAERMAGPAIQVELRPYIAEGQWVRIEGGSLEGVKGIVIERRNKKRVLVGIAAIGRGLEIDVDTRLLTAIPGP